MHTTGASGNAIDENRATATDSHTAAKFAPREPEVIPQHPEKGLIRFYLDTVVLPVDIDGKILLSQKGAPL